MCTIKLYEILPDTVIITYACCFRYFFKKACDEFDSGVVHEEIIDDSAVLPLWEGKVVGKVDKIE